MGCSYAGNCGDDSGGPASCYYPRAGFDARGLYNCRIDQDGRWQRPQCHCEGHRGGHECCRWPRWEEEVDAGEGVDTYRLEVVVAIATRIPESTCTYQRPGFLSLPLVIRFSQGIAWLADQKSILHHQSRTITPPRALGQYDDYAYHFQPPPGTGQRLRLPQQCLRTPAPACGISSRPERSPNSPEPPPCAGLSRAGVGRGISISGTSRLGGSSTPTSHPSPTQLPSQPSVIRP